MLNVMVIILVNLELFLKNLITLKYLHFIFSFSLNLYHLLFLIINPIFFMNINKMLNINLNVFSFLDLMNYQIKT